MNWNRQRSELGTVFYANDADDRIIYPDVSIGVRGGESRDYVVISIPAWYGSGHAVDRLERYWWHSNGVKMDYLGYHDKLADAKGAK